MKKITILALLYLIISRLDLLGQASTVPNTWVTPTDFLGWNTTVGSPPLYIKTELPQPINFYTNTGAGVIPATPNMQITSTGSVGIGTAAIPPVEILDIAGNIHMPQSGTINLNGGNQVFIANPIPSVIIMGINAGASLTGATACTFIGENAGSINTGSGGNTYLGWNSGAFATGYENTYVGSRSGNGQSAGIPFTGNNNVAIGESSAQLSKTGNNNCFLGVFSGFHNNANDNAFFGASSGIANDAGARNSFLGSSSGFSNVEGQENLFAGYDAGYFNYGNIVSNKGMFNVYLGSYSGYTSRDGNLNTFTGYRSGYFNTVSENSFFGDYSGEKNTTGVNNSFFGGQSGKNNTNGSDNSFLGFTSGLANTTGKQNLFSGSISGLSNTTGQDNSFLGFQSGFSNRTGKQNSFTGSQTGYTNSSADDNTFNGFKAGYLNTGASNTFLGSLSGTTNSTGTNNTFGGNKSGQNNQTGSYNVIIGDAAGATCTSGSKNTIIGSATNCAANAVNQIALGYATVTTTDDNMILGNNSVKVGIGLSAVVGGPLRKLEIVDASNPQFRLSNVYGTTGIYTDFETTSSGDLIIRPKDNTTQRRVGINTGTPNNTLEINSPATSPTAGGGNSGLQFTDLTTASTVNSTAFTTLPHGVLSVDGNGKVILVTDEGSGVVTACGGSSGTANYITKFTSATDICISKIYEHPTSHYIGVNTTSPLYQFHNFGTAMFSQTSLTTAAPMYNSTIYPLGVYSNNGTGGPAGLALFSAGTYTQPNANPGHDELNLYVDDNGQTVFRSLSHNTNFMSSYYNKSMFGLVPFDNSVVIKNDFSTSPGQPGSSLARLYVEEQDGAPDHNYAIWANFSNNNHSVGDFAAIRAESTTPYLFTNTNNIGVSALANGSNNVNFAVDGRAEDASNSNAMNIGGFFLAKRGITNKAVYGSAYGTQQDNFGGQFIANGTTTNYGVKGHADNGSINYGVYGSTDNTSGAANYGLYGKTLHNAPLCIMGGACTQAAGYFDGDVFVTNGTYITSDSTLKTNIMPLQNGMQLLQQLNAYTYNFDTTKTEDMNVPVGIQIGLLAQQVQAVFPGLVKGTVHPETKDSLGNIIHPSLSYLALNYIGLIPVLVGGIKEQHTLIDSLTLRLTNLETIVNNCCSIAPKGSGYNNPGNNNKSFELKNITTIFLDQNKPNPFSSQTDIDYYLPEDVNSADMLFFDQKGQNIKSVSLKERGKGTLHVYSPDLKNGTYTYSLVSDGKVIETKTMVKAK